MNLKSECARVSLQASERLKARLATVLIDHIRLGHLTPVVDAALVDYVLKKTKPLPIAKRARRLLRFVVDSTSSIDQTIYFAQGSTMESALGSCESTTFEEVVCLLDYLQEVGLVERMIGGGDFRATIRGFETIEQEDASPQESDQVFVALWFDDSTNELRSVIEDAIRQSGYEPFIVDDQAFEGLIDDAIVAGIRAAKFVVADLTHGEKGMRGSVYYEAGLARGQEKSVILTARKDHLEEQKIAFDLNHFPIINWSNEELPNFAKELRSRIEALFGRGPGV